MSSPCPSTTSNFEFAFTDKDFNRLKDMVISRTGINISDEKRQLVYSRFAKRIRRLGLKDFSDYIDFLDSANGDDERGWTLHHRSWFVGLRARCGRDEHRERQL